VGAIHPNDLAAGSLVFQLELEWAGQTIRLSDVEHEAPFGEDDAEVQFHGVLDLGDSFDTEIDLFSASPSARSFSASAALLGIIDAPKTVEEQGPPLLSPARLYVHPLDSSKRRLLVKGRVQGFTYGAAQEVVEIEVEQTADDDEGATHGPLQFMGDPALGKDAATWQRDTQADGEAYPLIIGKPGSGDGKSFGSPAFGCNLVSPSTGLMLVAGHRVAATSVIAENFSVGVSGTKSIVDTYSDVAGQPVAMFDPAAWASPTWNDGDETWIDWGASAGGIEVGGTLLRGAGDVLVWMLRRSSVEWDIGRVAAVRAALNKYLVDACVQPSPGETIRPWSWLSSELLPLLPVSISFGADGLYPVLWRPDATTRDAVAKLNADGDGNCVRLGAVNYSQAATARNDVIVAYGRDAKRNKHTRRVRVTGDPTIAERDSNANLDLMCRRSFARYGHRSEAVRANVIWDPGTAGRIARWRAAAFALPTRRIDYEVEQDLLWLDPGAVVTLTDTELGLSSAVALVESITLAGVSPRVSLRLYEQA